MKIYTGVGSRELPINIESLMEKIGSKLALKGWTLRSGGALGSDSAFEKGCKSVNGKKEIYLPWKNFGKKWNRESTEDDIFYIPNKAKKIAKDLVEEYQDFNMKSEEWVWNFIERNMCQILGKDLNTPSKAVICWTPNGKDLGGTRWAIRLARKHSIKIYNLGNKDVLDCFLKRIEEGGK